MCCIFPGYPPADHKVWDFLAWKAQRPNHISKLAVLSMLCFSIVPTIHWFDLQLGIEEVACKFRMHMMEGQTMKRHNEFRTQFYQQVVQIAKGKLTVCLPYLGNIHWLKVSHKVAQPGNDIGPGSPTAQWAFSSFVELILMTRLDDASFGYSLIMWLQLVSSLTGGNSMCRWNRHGLVRGTFCPWHQGTP